MPPGGLSTVISRFSSCWLPLIILFVTAFPVFTGESFVISERTLKRAEDQYGPDARQRLLDWQNLIQKNDGNNDLEKLEKVNRFMNKIPFIADAIHWGKDDYWATPVEFLASDGGDCEDFAIAKYFTLIRLGIAETQLNLTYVKALRLNQAHMVLTYYPAPGKEPLVLDNLINTIEPSSKRTDLLPVYSFNGSGLWLAKQRNRGKMIGDSSRLKRWQNLLDRMTEEFQDEDAP
jgi:predicted transglutaminase-like cysteine proteinase